VIGPSSEFISAASDFIEKNKTPLNVVFYSDRASHSFYDVTSFDVENNYETFMNFWRVRSKGGLNHFFSFFSEPTPESLMTVNLREMVRKARSRKLIEVNQTTSRVLESEYFHCKIPNSHISSIFFGINPTRPGYIIEPGEDESDFYDLDEKRNIMHVKTNDISRESNLYYFFSPDSSANVRSIGYRGIDVSVIKQEQIPKGSYDIS
jgi:hypothetical protein